MSEQSIFRSPDRYNSEVPRSLKKERQLLLTGWQQEVDRDLDYGLLAAESIQNQTISTFFRGKLPHDTGINACLKASHLADVEQADNCIDNCEVAVIGVLHNSSHIYHSGKSSRGEKS
jgi:agmatinase